MATPQLLRRLKTAANASKPFINACKRALENVLAQLDVSQSQGGGLSQEQDGVVGDEEELELKEEELRAWREATEPLQNILPENTIYFIPYTLLSPSSGAPDAASATTLLSRINAINLALTLEMFLPTSTRRKFPMLTTQIPFIDASSRVDGAAKVASSQPDEQSYPSSGFGLSQSQSRSQSQFAGHSGYSQSDLTQEQKIDLLTLPLAELKSVYLRLCAGRKEKHVLYVLRRVVLEICCISIITSTKARGLQTFKPKDLLDTFKVTFLKDPALVGNVVEGGVFANKEVQEKACKLWEKWAGDVMHRFQTPLNAQQAYTWDALADTLLTDLLRHVFPPVLEKLEVEGKRKVSFLTSTVSAVNTTATTTATNNNNNTHNRPRVPAPANDTQAGGGGKSTKPPENSTVPPAVLPDRPKGFTDSRFFMVNKKTAVKPAVTTSKPTAATIPKTTASIAPRIASSTTAPITISSTTAPKPIPAPTPTPRNLDEDEFGPRLVNSVHKSRVVLPDTERTVIHAPGTAVHEVDMMDYVQGYGDDAAGGFGNDDAGGAGNNDNEEREDEGTPFAVAVARFGQEPYIPAPKFGFTRVPENFRFNAPQRNAVKAVMTPSPESEKGSSHVPAKGSTLSRIKAAVVHPDRSKGTGASADPDAEDSPAEDTVALARKGLKRKQSDEEDEYVEEPRVKKRKGGNGKAMPPPARVPTARSSVASTTTTLVNPLPYAARHSSASSSTLFNPADMAGPSSSAGGTGALPPVRAITRRPVVMAADTESSDDEGPFRRRKPTTSSKAATTSSTTATKAAPVPAKSTSAAKTATATKKTSTAAAGKASAKRISTAAKETSTSIAAPVQPKPKKAIPLPVSDELMKSSKDRLSQIKEINEKNKRLYAVLVGEDDEEDPEVTEDSGDDNEEELRKFREREARGELRGPAIGDLEKSRNKLEDLKKRSKEVEKLPVRRRAKHIKGETGSSEEEDELDEEEEEEERVDVPRPRGRPRKNPKAKAKGAADTRERGPRAYKYAVGGNEHGRTRWTEDEDKILLFALEATFYEGDLLRPWQKIRDQYGPDGTEGKGLASRNVMQIKDRARAIAERLVRLGRERPDYLAWIKVSDKRIYK